jgi:hypothetical protein
MSIQKMNTPRERDTEMSNTPIKRSDCQCGVCAMLATATPTLHTHATQRAAQQCIQPGCIPPMSRRHVMRAVFDIVAERHSEALQKLADS